MSVKTHIEDGLTENAFDDLRCTHARQDKVIDSPVIACGAHNILTGLMGG